jgi:hypothetical protein
MRESCSNCAKKHLTQAIILLSESKKGYPKHRALALGHMAEAEDELIKEYPKQANKIRASRVKMEGNLKYDDNLDKLFDMVDKECDICNLGHDHSQPKTIKCTAGKKYNHVTRKCE